MVVPTDLKSPPIKEALVDIRVSLPQGITLAKLASLPEQVAKDYPEKQERRSGGFQIEFKEGKIVDPQVIDEGPDGFLCYSSDKLQLVQFRLDGFTFNRLKPYTSWKQIRGEAFRLWELYRTTVEPALISRIALRYINRIEIPLPLVDLRDYLAAPPSTPPNLSGNLSSFLTRVVVREPSARIEAIITQTGDVPGKPEQTALLLDIDVISQAVYDKDGKSAWETMERLREMKNRIFFESITLKALELFK